MDDLRGAKQADARHQKRGQSNFPGTRHRDLAQFPENGSDTLVD
jgi:hypothetical protein